MMRSYPFIFPFIGIIMAALCLNTAQKKETSSATTIIEFQIWRDHKAYWDSHTFEEQIQLVKSEQTVRKAISLYQLDKLYGVEASELLSMIRSSIKIKKISHATYAITFYAESPARAEQLSFAIIHVADDIQRDQLHDYENLQKKQFKEEFTSIKKLANDYKVILLQDCHRLGINFNRLTADQSIKSIFEYNNIKTLSPSETNNFILIKDNYFNQMKELKSLLDCHFQETIATGGTEGPYIYHKKGVSDEVADFMTKRRNSRTL